MKKPSKCSNPKMKIDLDQILELVQEIESQDPIDWGMLQIDEELATRLVVSSLVDQFNNNWSKLDVYDRDCAMMAIIAKLVVENFSLNLKLQL